MHFNSTHQPKSAQQLTSFAHAKIEESRLISVQMGWRISKAHVNQNPTVEYKKFMLKNKSIGCPLESAQFKTTSEKNAPLAHQA